MPAYSYYSSADPFIIPEEFSPDYFFLPRSVEPRGDWDHSSREFPYDKIPNPAPVQTYPQSRKWYTKGPKGPRASAPQQPQTSAMIRPVKAKGNWDYSAREFTHDPIPPPTSVRRGRKKNVEWVEEEPEKVSKEWVEEEPKK